MAFSFSPNLDTAISRVRSDVGDTTASGLMPDEIYSAVLTKRTVDGEVDEDAATRDMARKLAVRYATEPDRISSDGKTVSWAERVKQWNLIAKGQAGGGDTSVEGNSLTAGIFSFGFQEEACDEY